MVYASESENNERYFQLPELTFHTHPPPQTDTTSTIVHQVLYVVVYFHLGVSAPANVCICIMVECISVCGYVNISVCKCADVII